MCAVLTLQSNLVIVDQADASRHLGFSNLVADRYDDVVVNDDLDRATDELVRVLDMHERN